MGCCPTKVAADSSQDIQLPSAAEKSGSSKEIKVLLLGFAGSGKSTFFKQMKIIHLGGFQEKERQTYHGTILSSIAFSF